MAFHNRSKVQSLGYTPEALKVDEITKALRSRSGIHFFNGHEVASVFDLVEVARRI